MESVNNYTFSINIQYICRHKTISKKSLGHAHNISQKILYCILQCIMIIDHQIKIEYNKIQVFTLLLLLLAGPVWQNNYCIFHFYFLFFYMTYYCAICRPSGCTVGRPRGGDSNAGRAFYKQGHRPLDHHTSSTTISIELVEQMILFRVDVWILVNLLTGTRLTL